MKTFTVPTTIKKVEHNEPLQVPYPQRSSATIIKDGSRGRLDVCIATKNRLDNFRKVLDNLNEQTIAKQMNLFVMCGDEHSCVYDVLDVGRWNFPYVYIDYDYNHQFTGWASIYNHLFSLGSAENLTYWSDDIILKHNYAFEQALECSNYAAVAFYPRFSGNVKEKLIQYNNVPCISHGVIQRNIFERLGGLNESYQFYYADYELSLEIGAEHPIKLLYSPVANLSLHTREHSEHDISMFNEFIQSKFRYPFEFKDIKRFVTSSISLFITIDEFSVINEELSTFLSRIQKIFSKVSVQIVNKSKTDLGPFTSFQVTDFKESDAKYKLFLRLSDQFLSNKALQHLYDLEHNFVYLY